MALFVIFARMVFQTVFSGFATEAFIASLVEGAKLSTWVIAFGILNSVYDFRKLLKHSPRFLRGFTTALSIAISLTPEMARNVTRVRSASKLRSTKRGFRLIRSLIVPVMSNAVDQAINLAESMDARGFRTKQKRFDSQLEFKNLSFGYPNKVIFKNISLHLEPGSFTLISGNTGSGKSTLLKLIQARVQGAGFVNQNPRESFIEDTVHAELGFAAIQADLDPKTEVQKIAEEFGLSELLASNPQELSAGWQQRVAIAASLTGGSKFLILDEPFSALDKTGTAQLLETLADLKALEITIVIAEHRVNLLSNLVDRVIQVSDHTLVDTEIHLTTLERKIPTSGTVIAIVGENGSGKTTHLRELAAKKGVLVPQPASDILYLDSVAQELKEADQDAQCEPGTTEKLLHQFDIEIDLDQNPRDLSSGEKLTLALCIQLAKGREHLLLDEPTLGLDPFNRQALVNHLSQIAESGVEIVIATHDQEFINALAAEIRPIEQVRVNA